jgi:urease gamma subunit
MTDPPPFELPPMAIHDFDQAFKESEDFLSSLVTSYALNRKKDIELGYPEAVSVVSCSIFLTEQIDSTALASALAVAIVAFARNAAVSE